MTEKNKTKVTVIVPPVVVHNLDPHTGIPFLPHMAAYLTASINSFGYDVNVIDCFGENSHHRKIYNQFMVLGLDESQTVSKLDKDVKICFIYCKVIEDLFAVEKIVKKIKELRPEIKVCLFENIQTTNSFSLKKIVDYLFNSGCDLTIFGEPERRVDDIIKCLSENKNLDKIPGIAYLDDEKVKINENEKFNDDLDNLPFPLWEKFNMEGYWKIGFAHAPIKKNKKFLPILSSRGCPYRCKFCVSPTLNPNWRKRTPKSVVDEMEYLHQNLDIDDFHFSDLDPTVNEKRIVEMCKEIISRNLKFEWKLAQGTKMETIKNESTLKLMKDAGLTFFSFSPESGSVELMKKLNKPFDYNHALKMTSHLNKLNIKTQACFIAGTPPETEKDRKESLDYVKKLIKNGLDEIAVFIYSPIPGSYFADQIGGFKHYSELTRSPKWRKDYRIVNSFRIRMYLTFFLYKMIYSPKKIIQEIYRIITRNFSTKMEMALFKFFKLRIMHKIPKFFK